MIAFVDTESNPISKHPSSIQVRYSGVTHLFTDFSDEVFTSIKNIWNEAEAVVMFNAPYDLGVLSSMFTNEYHWVEEQVDGNTSSYWKFRIFDNDYNVRKITSHRNLIKGLNKYHGKENTRMMGFKNTKPKYMTKIPHTNSTPLIDLLKLWSILIDDGEYGSIGLKAIVEREFGYKMLPWSPDNALNERYMSEDVEYLEKLWFRFLEKVKGVSELSEFTLDDFAYIKTPATFTKILYENEYPLLKEYQKKNDEIISQHGLEHPLESAFHGGITLSFFRGTTPNVVWVDIEGAYVKAIQVLNTDSFIQFDIEKSLSFDMNRPYLLKIKSNFMLKTLNKSLKMYYVKELETTWMWNYDVDAIRHMVDDFKYEILEIYKPIPLINVKTSLTNTWQERKNSLDKKNQSERVLREFYKFLGNTSYGAKAQRNPFRTVHTNMLISGMITSKVHQVLGKIIYTGRVNGYDNLYNDTDSAAFHFSVFNTDLIDKVNKKISPFKVNSEGVFKDNLFLSLKRYVSENDTSKDYNLPEESNKIKIHGKGRYNVNRTEILDFIQTQKVINEDECLMYGSMSANTARTMKMILNLDGMKELITSPHPFMFVNDVVTDRTRKEFFESWYDHIDTKLTYSKTKSTFHRQFRRFNDSIEASIFYSGKIEAIETVNMDFRNWDAELSEDFSDRQ